MLFNFRCDHCSKLLAQVGGEYRVRIKCPRCKKMCERSAPSATVKDANVSNSD